MLAQGHGLVARAVIRRRSDGAGIGYNLREAGFVSWIGSRQALGRAGSDRHKGCGGGHGRHKWGPYAETRLASCYNEWEDEQQAELVEQARDSHKA